MRREERSELISRIKQAADCRSIFRQFWPGRFRERGNCFCPFHEDSQPSLQVSRELAFCHAENLKLDAIDLYARATGLSFKAAVQELADRYRVADAGCRNEGKADGSGNRRIVAVYDYTDAGGGLVYQTVRFEPKGFRQRRPARASSMREAGRERKTRSPDQPGGSPGRAAERWIWDLSGVQRVPYRLPEALKADTVFVVEGEKDADRLAREGLAATTNSEGAGKWRPELSAYFAGKKIVILPDNDDPGKRHALDAAAKLSAAGASSVKIVELPGLPPKGDVSDWFDAGGSRQALLELVGAGELPEPGCALAKSPRAKGSGGAEESNPGRDDTAPKRKTHPSDQPAATEGSGDSGLGNIGGCGSQPSCALAKSPRAKDGGGAEESNPGRDDTAPKRKTFSADPGPGNPGLCGSQPAATEGSGAGEPPEPSCALAKSPRAKGCGGAGLANLGAVAHRGGVAGLANLGAAARRRSQPVLTEDGIALVFAERFADQLKYCHHTGSWFRWEDGGRGTEDGGGFAAGRWVREQTELAFDLARSLCRELSREASIGGDPPGGRASKRCSGGSGGPRTGVRGRLRLRAEKDRRRSTVISKASTALAVERFARADRRLAVTSEVFDRDIWLLNTPSGVVDLRDGSIRDASREDFMTRQTTVGAEESNPGRDDTAPKRKARSPDTGLGNPGLCGSQPAATEGSGDSGPGDLGCCGSQPAAAEGSGDSGPGDLGCCGSQPGCALAKSPRAKDGGGAEESNPGRDDTAPKRKARSPDTGLGNPGLCGSHRAAAEGSGDSGPGDLGCCGSQPATEGLSGDSGLGNIGCGGSPPGLANLGAAARRAAVRCPLWSRFLSDVTRGDADLQRFLCQMAGLCLTGSIREHALFFIYGPGGNGKSVFLNTLVNILGDYATTAAMDTFTASKSDRHPTDLAMLRGARLVTASETEEGKSWAESRIKQLTGGDRICARFMRQDFFEYVPQFKLIVIGNHRPILRNVDRAARRRFNIIPFIHTPEVPDRQLEEKLKSEYPAILRWMIEGCLDWQKEGLVRPRVVLEATENYFDEQDTFGRWIEECCAVGPREWETTTRLFASWKSFAERNGEYPGNARSFGLALSKRGLQAGRTTVQGATQRIFKGIAIKPGAPGEDL